MSSPDSLPELLRRQLCDSFAVRPAGDDRWVVSTPLLYGDGDAVPVFLVRHGGDWTITDEGMTVSHLFFDDFEPTESRMQRLHAAASVDGAEVSSDHSVTLRLDGAPTAHDVGDFLQIVAGLRGAAISLSAEREQTRYVGSVRHRVTQHLAYPDWEPNWQVPDVGAKARYRVDLKLSTAQPDEPVALFIASTGEKTAIAALAVIQLKTALAAARPLLAHHPKVGSEAVFRFQDQVGDDDSVVAVPPGQVDQLLPALQRRGVAVEPGP